MECSIWKYSSDEEEGDKDWDGLCENGFRQSPIDLSKNNVFLSKRIEPLSFIHYNRPVRTNITNNGHSVVLTLEQQKGIAIAAGGLHSYYILDSVHFHWGGSEHTFNNKRLAMEVHLVHYNGEYDNVTHARDKTRGLAVIAVLFYETPNDNAILEPIISSMADAVNDAGESSILDRSFSPSELLPLDRSYFFRYDGSLTTPPCLESVVWTVMYRTIGASKKQLDKFKSINSDHGDAIKYNYRRTQPYNDRNIFFVETSGHYDTLFQPDAGIRNMVSFPMVIIVALFAYWITQYQVEIKF